MAQRMGDAYLIIFGPSCLALLLVLFASICAKTIRAVVTAWGLAMGLHLLGVLVFAALLGSGEAWSGTGSGHDYPRRFCIIGLAVLAVPPIIRLIYDGAQTN
jgi:hypothetical protein